MSRRSNSLKCAAVALLLTGSGCSTLTKSPGGPNEKSWSPSTWFKKEYQEPASLAAIWSPDTLAVAGQPVSRGFGGRIYFYNDRSQAVPIEGELMVHGYLTTPGLADASTVQPDQKFAFSAEQLSGHFSPSEIGASYSIWIPWDQIDGYREEVTLIPTFKSKNGTVVQGAPAKVFLPGKTRSRGALPSPNVQSVSYQNQSSHSNSNDAYARNSYVSNSYGLETRTKADANFSSSLPKMNTIRTTTIAVPDNATLNRRPSNSFILGGSKGSSGNHPSNTSGVQVGGSGVGVGGGQRINANASGPASPAVTSTPSPSVDRQSLSGPSVPPQAMPVRPTAANSAQLNLRTLPPPPVVTAGGTTIQQPQSRVETASATSAAIERTQPRFAPVKSAGFQSN